MYKTLSFSTKTELEYQGIVSLPNLSALFAGCDDFQTRRVDLGGRRIIKKKTCWLDGLVSGERVSEDILRPLTQATRSGGAVGDPAVIEQILRGAVYRCAVQARTTLADTVDDLTHGCCVLLFEQAGAALSFEVRCENTRAVAQPTLEKSLKGAKDSFVEALRTNTALVRRRVCSPRLKLRERSVGRRSHTRFAILYIEGIVSPELVAALDRRLDRLDVDALLATGTLEEFIVDTPLSPFPQLLHTERPDRFAMYLLDGRVGLLVDGLPVALVLPVTFAEFMKVTGDASVHYTAATALTLLRWTALLLSLLTPAVYVAVAKFHPVQEAGLRLPNPVGDTVSIIGALIVGQAAVEARLVSPISIIVVAISGISCYALPSQDLASAIRLCRLGLLLAAIAAGLYGVGLGCCLLLLHLSDLESFGVNYTAPLSESEHGLSRLLLRIPKAWNKYRDPLLRTPDRRRQG